MLKASVDGQSELINIKQNSKETPRVTLNTMGGKNVTNIAIYI